MRESIYFNKQWKFFNFLSNPYKNLVAKGIFPKKNKIIRFAIVLALFIFFFCIKLETAPLEQNNSGQLKTSIRSPFFQIVYAQSKPAPSTPYGDPSSAGTINYTSDQLPSTNTLPKSDSPGWGERAISWGITTVLAALKALCGLFLIICNYFLNAMLSPNLYNFTSEPIITTGWVAVRDVCNLFFLLILLFIAFCTILQIEKYHAKKILLTFILMALLVNFSKPIAIFIFDGSQLLMNFFLTKISSASGGDIGGKMMETSAIMKGVDALTSLNQNTLWF